jgi:hypothetical protein
MRSVPAEARESSAGLNGEPRALAVDRAIGELRRGRAIALADKAGALVIAAVETTGTRLLTRLLDASTATSLFLTAERARAGGIASETTGPIALRLAHPTQIDALKALAGIAAGGTSPPPGIRRIAGEEAALVLAAFGLAKAARLIPALIGYRACTPYRSTPFSNTPPAHRRASSSSARPACRSRARSRAALRCSATSSAAASMSR